MLRKERLDALFFPYSEARAIQEDMIEEVDNCIKLKKNLIVHAPTGLGKTASSLPMALSHALEKGLTVFFLTSRHTQHLIALETLKEIKKKFSKEIIAVDLIGKKWMCPVPGVDALYSSEFFEYCKAMRADGKCEHYVNCRKKSGVATINADKAVDELKRLSPYHCEDLVSYCASKKLCPYEVSTLLAKDASIIIADYYYIFSPSIRDTFFKKTEKELSQCIIIIDEAHNLPSRARKLLTQNLSSFSINNALKEATKLGYEDAANYLKELKEMFKHYESEFVKSGQQQFNRDFFAAENERMITKEEFMSKVKNFGEYGEIIANFEFSADEIMEKQKKSYVGSIGNFLSKWEGQDNGFARILSFKTVNGKPNVTLSYKCMDPSLLTKDVAMNAYSSILMSGTLTPTSMYKDILGFSDAVEKEYLSPFPSENKLCMIIPDVTTKFTSRSPEMYKKIAERLAKIVNAVPGNSAVFFPSYKFRDDVNTYFSELCKKTTFVEIPGMNKTDKQDLLEKFKGYKKYGACLLGVAAANFSEGVDLPGDLLKAVVVVGLPLQKPDLETKELIDYYDKKYGFGWDYAYTFPAITKTLQSAGRCIRSEKDRGVIVFLDERYSWPKYSKCFPASWNMKITKLYEERITEFFEVN